MHINQLADRFEINHDLAFDQQIQPVLADFHVTIIQNRRFELLFGLQPALPQFTDQSILVN